KQIAGTQPPDLTEDAFTALRLYHWPGNVRQLKNCLERAVILSNNGRITLSELPPEVTRPAVPAPALTSVVPSAVGGDTAVPMPVLPSTSGSLREVERQQILAALEQTGWHR